MPACKVMVRTMTGKEAESEIGKVPVCDNAINRLWKTRHTALKIYCLKY
jgi:hypothetical protein